MKKLWILGLPLVMLMACEKDDNIVDNPGGSHEEELITTLQLDFLDSAGTVVTTAIFKDEDGDGGNPPSRWDTINLTKSLVYTCEIRLLNESETPAEDITAEVEEEGDEHIICFTPTDTNLIITTIDKDENGLDLGLESSWVSSETRNSFVRVQLKHQPNGLKDGTCQPGETDIDVTFRVTVN